MYEESVTVFRPDFTTRPHHMEEDDFDMYMYVI